jgi:hypothetical protein
MITNNLNCVDMGMRSVLYALLKRELPGINEYFAIPEIELDAENATGKIYLKQNSEYQGRHLCLFFDGVNGINLYFLQNKINTHFIFSF